MSVNPLDGLGAILKADAAVTALANGRVYWPQLPKGQQGTSPCVVLRPAGGDIRFGSSQMQLADPRVDTDCYGSTSAQSWQLHLAVRAAFKNAIRTVAGNVLVHSVAVSSGGVTAEDPDTSWLLTIASYMPVVSELTVVS